MTEHDKQWKANLMICGIQLVFGGVTYNATECMILAFLSAAVAAGAILVNEDLGFSFSSPTTDAAFVAFVAAFFSCLAATVWDGTIICVLLTAGVMFVTGLAASVLVRDYEQPIPEFVLLLPFGIGLIGDAILSYHEKAPT